MADPSLRTMSLSRLELLIDDLEREIPIVDATVSRRDALDLQRLQRQAEAELNRRAQTCSLWA